jgi:hypothetical protein
VFSRTASKPTFLYLTFATDRSYGSRPHGFSNIEVDLAQLGIGRVFRKRAVVAPNEWS